MVGAYDWEGGVLKEAIDRKVIPLREAFEEEFPVKLKNHAAYLGNFSNCFRTILFLGNINPFGLLN